MFRVLIVRVWLMLWIVPSPARVTKLLAAGLSIGMITLFLNGAALGFQGSGATPVTAVAISGNSTDEPETNSSATASTAEPIDTSFDDLKFDIEKGAAYKPSMLTDEIKKLDGKTIRLRGFVRPGFKQNGIKQFVLVRDNQECCFGPGAALYDCVMVKMADDQSIDFTVRPISVVGTLYLKEFVGKDKKVWAIFRMKDAKQD